MKKSLLVLTIGASLAFSACGGDEDNNKSTNNKTTAGNNKTSNNKKTTNKSNNKTANNKASNNKTTNNKTTNNKTTSNNATTTNNKTTTGTNGNCVESTLAGPCDALCQTGCMAGQTCVAGAAPGEAAKEICQPTGAGKEDGTCDPRAQMGCEAGLGCLGGTCRKYCRTSEKECGAGKSCQAFSAATDIGICLKGCKINPNDCAAGKKCLPASATDAICIPVGTAAIGAACSYNPNAPILCVDGALCNTNNNVNKCAKLCNPAANPSDCANGKTCQGVQGGGQSFGICI